MLFVIALVILRYTIKLVMCDLMQLFLNAALYVEIQRGNQENEKLVKDINDLKTTLLSTITTNGAWS